MMIANEMEGNVLLNLLLYDKSLYECALARKLVSDASTLKSLAFVGEAFQRLFLPEHSV